MRARDYPRCYRSTDKIDSTNQQVVNFAGRWKIYRIFWKSETAAFSAKPETVLQYSPAKTYQCNILAMGDIVDAVIFIKDKIIPIDSKSVWKL